MCNRLRECQYRIKMLERRQRILRKSGKFIKSKITDIAKLLHGDELNKLFGFISNELVKCDHYLGLLGRQFELIRESLRLKGNFMAWSLVPNPGFMIRALRIGWRETEDPATKMDIYLHLKKLMLLPELDSEEVRHLEAGISEGADKQDHELEEILSRELLSQRKPRNKSNGVANGTKSAPSATTDSKEGGLAAEA